MNKKNIWIAAALALIAITAGIIGVIHEVRSSHEIPTQNAVIQDIPEQTGMSYVEEEGSTITEHASDTTDSSENEIAIISPEGEVVTIGQEHDLSDATDIEQSNNSETDVNTQAPSEQKEQSTSEKTASEKAASDSGTLQSDSEVSSTPLENQETGNSGTNSEASPEETQVYETIRIPVK